MKNLKLSIIAAAYNEWENVRNFFNFWLYQDYANYEIVIVDDWSKDNTLEIIQQYCAMAPDKIRLVRNDKNRWVGYARYNGYLHATWAVLKFSDTDIAEDYPMQKDLVSRLMKPFNDDDAVDAVYIDYYPYFDDKNIVRSLENFYYYSPVIKSPANLESLRIPSSHMPTLFRNKKIDLSWIQDIKNGEDRFIAVEFLKESKKNALSHWNIVLDVNNKTIKELFERYFKYGKNSLWILKSNKKLFISHLIKPMIITVLILLFIIWLIIGNILLISPFILLYLCLLLLTIKWSLYYKKTRGLFLFKIIGFWPFFLISRYVSVFVGLLDMLLLQLKT